MINSDKWIEKKNSSKSCQQGDMSRARKDWKERKTGVKTFHSLRVTLPMHKRITATLECGHLPLQVRPINYFFQQLQARDWRVMFHDPLYNNPSLFVRNCNINLQILTFQPTLFTEALCIIIPTMHQEQQTKYNII